MSEEAIEYLGKFELDKSGSPELQILVIKERGTVCFVGEGIDHPGSADSPAEREAQLRIVLPEHGIHTEVFRFVGLRA